MIGFIAFGALVALGAFNVSMKRRKAQSDEIVARHQADKARAEAEKAKAETEALRIKNPPRRPGRPTKAPEVKP